MLDVCLYFIAFDSSSQMHSWHIVSNCVLILQNFAKSLLDVADNLNRASFVTKESANKIDASKDTVGAMPLLKSLLEGVEMTEKQLAEVTSPITI